MQKAQPKGCVLVYEFYFLFFRRKIMKENNITIIKKEEPVLTINEPKFLELEERIKKYIKENYPNGYDLYVDYNDTINNDDINQILESKNPEDSFNEWLWEVYTNSDYDIYTDVYDEIQKELKLTPKEIDYMDDCYQEFRDVINENLCINFPEDHYLDQELCCNIIIDNGDQNTDFDYHHCYPHYDAKSTHENLSRMSGMMLLANLQGYSTKKFRKIYNLCKTANNTTWKKLKEKYPFVTSCYEEIENSTSSCSALFICVKATLRELIQWHTKKTDIIITPKIDTIGLYNYWAGGGSLLEVKLEKTITIPKDKIFDFLPDESFNTKKGGIYYGYSIEDCYGMCESAWEKQNTNLFSA